MPLTPNRVLGIKQRYAMYFDGVDDYVAVSHSSSLNIVNSITIGARIKMSALPSVTGNQEIINKSYWNIWRFFGNPSNNALRFVQNIGGTTYDTVGGVLDLEWHQVFVTYDGSTIRLYMDAWTVATKTATGSLATSTSRVLIGIFFGFIHEVFIYNRALSSSEIQHMHLDPYYVPRDGLVLWLKAHPDNVKDIDNDGILEWIDLSGYNNHGKIYGATITKMVKDATAVSLSKRILSVVR